MTQDCCKCGACGTQCPSEAISKGKIGYVIDANRCTGCVGFFAEPQCVVVCPLGCLIPDPHRVSLRDVATAIKKALERNARLDAEGIQVDAVGGKVILRGKIRTWAEREDAVAAASSAPGVTQIEDHMEVDPSRCSWAPHGSRRNTSWRTCSRRPS